MRRRIISNAARGGFPWDYRVAYVQSPGTAYFLLNVALPGVPVLSDGREEVWRAKLECVGTNTSDRKFFGRILLFGMATINGFWRPSARFAPWLDAKGYPISNNNPIVFECDNSHMRLYSSDGTLFYSVANDFVGGGVLEPDLDIAVGSCVSYDERHFWSLSDGKQTHNIYSFSRSIGGAKEFDLVPCVMGGVAGFLDLVGGKFLSSVSNVPFTAGPRVADDGTPLEE